MFKRNPDISYFYPHTVSNIRQFKELASAINPELDLLWDNANEVLKSSYLDLSNVEGIERWERMLSLKAIPGMSLEDRIFAINTIIMQGRGQYTERYVAELIRRIVCPTEQIGTVLNCVAGITMEEYQTLIDTNQVRSDVNYAIIEWHKSYVSPANVPVNVYYTDRFTLQVDTENQAVKVKLNLKNKYQRQSIEDLLERIIPLNMTLEVELQYNTHEIVGLYKNNQLALNTHGTIREEDVTNWLI